MSTEFRQRYSFAPNLYWIGVLAVTAVGAWTWLSTSTPSRRRMGLVLAGAAALLLATGFVKGNLEGYQRAYTRSRNLQMAFATLASPMEIPRAVLRFLYPPDEQHAERLVAEMRTSTLGLFATDMTGDPSILAAQLNPVPAGPNADGFLDGGDCIGATGWACDPTHPDTPVEVDIWIGESLIGTVTANWFRWDLLAAGKGNGRHRQAQPARLPRLQPALAAMGVYVAGADDAPGAAVLGMLLMVAGVVLGVRATRNRLPAWAARTALAAGVAVAAFAAFLIHGAVVTAPLFAQSQEVPSVVGPAPSTQHAAAVERARKLVRAAVVEQNLPGVSVAVGAGDAVVWAEGFGWRDVNTQAPVAPDTRFNIGTASSAISAAVAPLGLTSTGTEPVAAWSPSHLGEPEDDFPPLTLLRHVVFRPLGLAPDQPLPGNRATFYVPLSDDDPARGRREMYMRDMECCPNRMAFYSTPSDLVRVALAMTPGSIDGELAGGMVMSLVTGDDGRIAVAVTSNIARASTSTLALRVADAFTEQRR